VRLLNGGGALDEGLRVGDVAVGGTRGGEIVKWWWCFGWRAPCGWCSCKHNGA